MFRAAVRGYKFWFVFVWYVMYMIKLLTIRYLISVIPYLIVTIA